ncbi:MAG: sigma-54-dependent Fis family transcriptional regulator [Gemmatimonadaceae bacterium]|nr:sigma-54-dependent Fis family transcriptional regulator [Gemmatimonadaceae bacterium]
MKEQTRIKVLVAEDEANLGTILEGFLTGRGYSVTTCRDGRAALAAMRAESYDVALLDIVMPEMDGLEVLRQVREEPTPPEVIIITGNGTIETAITAMKLGAYDYMSKPYRMAEIDVLVRRAWEKRQLARENAFLQSRLSRVDAVPEIITQYAPMQAVLQMVERVAKSDASVLITGESGTGKELVAKAVHRLSNRADAPLVDINCAAIAENLMESELFGHEKGAFTGALARKTGLFEMAAGGTLFMDEIGELDPKLQGKLLRALETGTFFRVGGTQKVEVNVRIIAATNKDLGRMVQDGQFRQDLLYRINTLGITLPPLRDRTVDIPLIAGHFLRRYGGANPPKLSEEAVAELQEYSWPGNVRELRNVIERAVLLANGGVIYARDLPLAPPTNGDGERAAGSDLTLEELERRHIEAILHQSNWHQGRAASVLGISSKTLYRKIREYGFQRPREG